MVRVGHLWVGAFETHHLSEVAFLCENAPDLIHSFEYALITRVDSQRQVGLDLPSVRLMASQGLSEIRQLGEHLMVRASSLRRMAAEFGFFSGFDEVWFFREPPTEPLPQGLEIRSCEVVLLPYAQRRAAAIQAMAELEPWMRRSAAIIGIADGVGLDYVTLEEEPALLLERLYFESD